MSEEERIAAARKMGQARTEKKREASSVSLEKARAARWTEEAKADHSQTMRNIRIINTALNNCPAEWEDVRIRNWIRTNLSKEIPVEAITKQRQNRTKRKAEEAETK